ncbi:hypothetical protein [Fodinicola feengrottensis]|uniref:hypothetical protein n=1 Tax=Fodinicola feengrottensis TaxID=435914 RepID=UPI0031D07F51
MRQPDLRAAAVLPYAHQLTRLQRFERTDRGHAQRLPDAEHLQDPAFGLGQLTHLASDQVSQPRGQGQPAVPPPPAGLLLQRPTGPAGRHQLMDQQRVALAGLPDRVGGGWLDGNVERAFQQLIGLVCRQWSQIRLG